MGAGGGARAGCMGFSLVGVLVAVGLVVWLGSRVSDEVARDRDPAGQGSVVVTTEASGAAVDVRADPSTELTGDASITVSASGLQPGEKVAVLACSSAVDALPTEIGACDAGSEVTTTASAAGNIEVRLAMPRVLTASGLPIDCASAASRCEVRVRGLDSVSGGRTGVTFAEDLDPPELMTDLGS